MWKNRRHSALTAGNCISMHAFFGWFLKAEAFFQISLEFPFIEGQWLLIKVKSRFSSCLEAKPVPPAK